MFARSLRDGEVVWYAANGWPERKNRYTDGLLQEIVEYDPDGLVRCRRRAREDGVIVPEFFPFKRSRESESAAENGSKRRCMEGP